MRLAPRTPVASASRGLTNVGVNQQTALKWISVSTPPHASPMMASPITQPESFQLNIRSDSTIRVI